MEIERCPVCGEVPRHLHTIDRFRPSFDVLQCPSCTLQMQSEIPSDPAIHYDRDYYEGRAEYSYRDERAKAAYDRHVWRARLRNIARFRPPPADFLDVGCAFGGFVSEAAFAGYRARGMDVSQFAVDEARKRGVDCLHDTLCNPRLPLEADSLDIVTMIEVFEHLEDPLLAMENLRRILRPGGLLLIQTANFCGRQALKEGRDYHYYLPGHLFYYSTISLRRLFEKYGFSDVRFYRGADFGLLPKLLKSRGDFESIRDYARWLKIAAYHLKSKIAFGDFALTSSMVAYARRENILDP